MSDLPLLSRHFSGGQNLTAEERGAGGQTPVDAPLFEAINAAGQTAEVAEAGATVDYSDTATFDAAAVKALSRGITKNTGAAATITLPDFSEAPDGWERTFLALDGTTNNVTVQRAGADTINGGASVVLDADGAWVKVFKVPGDTEWTALVALS